METILAALRARWATHIIGKGTAMPRDPAIPTGFLALDHALGGVMEVKSTPTSRIRTLALKVIASAQEKGDSAVWLDPESACDFDYAGCRRRCGRIAVRPARPGGHEGGDRRLSPR